MLCNGYGEHNIQGIGDKHIPLIHNVMNTDVVDRRLGRGDRRAQPAVRQRRRPRLSRPAGRSSIRDLVRQFDDIGISGLANIVAAIKIAKHFDYGPDDVVMTVATDGAELYAQRAAARIAARRYPRGFDEVNAGEIFGRCTRRRRRTITCSSWRHVDRTRIFNLGYYTWVEQQGVSGRRFRLARKDQRFWRGLVDSIPAWDRLIDEFNAEVGVSAGAPGIARSRARVPAHERRGDLSRAPGRTWRSATAACARRSMSLEEAASFVHDGDSRRHRRQHDVAHADGR